MRPGLESGPDVVDELKFRVVFARGLPVPGAEQVLVGREKGIRLNVPVDDRQVDLVGAVDELGVHFSPPITNTFWTEERASSACSIEG